MATGGYDFEMPDASNYPLPENYDRDIGETSFSNPIYNDATTTTYNTDTNSNLSSDSTFTPQEVPVPVKSIYDIHNEISDLYSFHKNSELETKKLLYLRNPKFTDGTKWRFTVTNRLELVDLVYTYGEVEDFTNHLTPDNIGVIGPYFDDYHRYRQENSLYMIGIIRGGKMAWVRITDNYGKLLSRSTIEGRRGGKMVADKLSELSHYYESTGIYADLKRKKENEE